MAPADRAIADGKVQVRGTVSDLHLAGWKLEAKDSHGAIRNLASWQKKEEEAEQTELQAVIDLSTYSDGENVVLNFSAWDEAGNEEKADRTLIRVGGAMSAFEPTLDLFVPELIKEAQVSGSYVGPAQEEKTLLYIDGELQETVTGGNFLLDAVRYAEGSSHTVSAISIGKDGSATFSRGFGVQQLEERVFEAGLPEEKETVWVSREYQAVRDMLGLRLNVTDYTPGDSLVRYEYSIDGGLSWYTVVPDVDTAFSVPAEHVKLRAVFEADGTNIPQLYRISISGILEFSPQTFTVKLWKDSEYFQITGPDTVKNALADIECNLAQEDAEQTVWYLDGKTQDVTGAVVDAREIEEEMSGSIAGAFKSGDTLWLSGGSGYELQREALGKTGEVVELPEVTCPKKVQVLRLLSAVRDTDGVPGTAEYWYSTDHGRTWIPMSEGDYTFLPEATDTVRIKVVPKSGNRLMGLSLSGYAAGGYQIQADLVEEPVQVLAADYGKTENKKVVLSWKDGREEDTTADHVTAFEIYKNGVATATVSETEWTDTKYLENASYGIRTIKTYSSGSFAKRESRTIKAEHTVIKSEKKEAVKKELKEYQQEKRLTSLYSGNATFTVEEPAPEDTRALNQALLGSNRQCSFGFEPVNFNTGNFMLEALDYRKSQASGMPFEILRTYNAQSETTDGAFGEKWASEYTQHLCMYQDGTVGYRKWDGALVLFTEGADGMVCSTSDHLRLEKEGDGFTITTPEGKQYGFDHYGLLVKIIQSGMETALERDENGVLTKVRTSFGWQAEITADEKGHITSIALPGGAQISYRYDGNRLISMTDVRGNTVRYIYDAEGRMTEWYDAAGNRQVENTYDVENRVVFQRDAVNGTYTLEYEKGHTTVTDADGKGSGIWYDQRFRTIKEADAEGNTYFYDYDATGNLTAKTDGEGHLTSYQSDEKGNITQITRADGNVVKNTYDDSGRLLTETDGNGNITHYKYDENGNLIHTTYADGSEVVYSYDKNGCLIQQTDENGHTVIYTYDEAGNILTSTDSLGNVSSYEYDMAGNCTAAIDPLGNRMEWTYDAAGNKTSEQVADGTVKKWIYDASGNIASETDGEGNTTVYEYDSFGNLTHTAYPDGSEESCTYDGFGHMLSKADAFGNASLYKYDGAGNLIEETDSLGRKTKYTYNADGQKIEMLLPSGAKEIYQYNVANGLMSGTTDSDGKTYFFSYDANGNLTEQFDEYGVVQRNVYDTRDRIIKTTDALGNSTEYTYDGKGNLLSVMDPQGNMTGYAYDAADRLIRETDALGNATVYEYDATGNCVKRTDPLGGVTTWEYDAAGRKNSERDALGNMIQWEYDAEGREISETDALGNQTRTEYDSMGRIIRQIGKRGGVTTYSYDAVGNLISQTFLEKGSVSYTYDVAHQQISMTDVDGKQVEMAYDMLGNITATLMEDGTGTEYDYDTSGHLLRMTDETGKETVYTYNQEGQILSVMQGEEKNSYTYDRNGNILSITDGKDVVVQYRYDAAGNRISAEYPDGSSDYFGYDGLGRIIWAELHDGTYAEYDYDAADNLIYQNENGRITTCEYDLAGHKVKETVNGISVAYDYDAVGNLIAETDEAGNRTAWEYDADGNITAYILPDETVYTCAYDLENRLVVTNDATNGQTCYRYDMADHLIAATDALGNMTSYEYDSYGNIISVTDALGNKTEYEYNGLGQLLSETTALGNRQSYTYTEKGCLASKTNGKGETTTYTYDTDSNLIRTEYADGSSVELVWDESGRLISSEGADGKTSYQYDAGGNLQSVSFPDGNTVGYEYDTGGLRTALVYPDGSRIEYGYDELDRLISVTGKDSSVTYIYNNQGQCIGLQRDGMSTAYTYDGNGRLTGMEISGDVSFSASGAYDENGNLIREVRIENGKTNTSSYAYDELHRLISWEDSDGHTEAYTYDAAGNMVRKLTDGKETVMAYDADNRLVSSENGDGITSYRYDVSGNLTERDAPEGKTSYQYDAGNHLSSYEKSDGTKVTYCYSSTGLLLSRREGEKETGFAYDIIPDAAQLIETTTNVETETYLYGRERIAAYTEKGWMDYLHDLRGSVAGTAKYADTGSAPDISWYHYTPYGESITDVEDAGAGTFRYNGEWYDGTVQSYYLHARFYTPEVMHFTQPDIERGNIYVPQSLNRYAYVQNNPVLYEDPNGESLVPALFALGAAGKGLAAATKSTSARITAQAKVTRVAKTAGQFVRNVKNSAGMKVIAKAATSSLTGRTVAQIGRQAVKSLRTSQTKALAEAQKIYQQAGKTTAANVHVLNRKLEKACSLYQNRQKLEALKQGGKRYLSQKEIGELVNQAVRTGNLELRTEDEWTTVYDEESIYEIRKQIDAYYLSHPGEREQVWLENGGKAATDQTGKLLSNTGKALIAASMVYIGGKLVLIGGSALGADALAGALARQLSGVSLAGQASGGMALAPALNTEVVLGGGAVALSGAVLENAIKQMIGKISDENLSSKSNEEIKNVYNSIKEAPDYPKGFQEEKNGTTKNQVKNRELLELLRKIEKGTWKKVYKDGYDANGNKISIHYFQSESGKVFDVKVKFNHWSNIR